MRPDFILIRGFLLGSSAPNEVMAAFDRLARPAQGGHGIEEYAGSPGEALALLRRNFDESAPAATALPTPSAVLEVETAACGTSPFPAPAPAAAADAPPAPPRPRAPLPAPARPVRGPYKVKVHAALPLDEHHPLHGKLKLWDIRNGPPPRGPRIGRGYAFTDAEIEIITQGKALGMSLQSISALLHERDEKTLSAVLRKKKVRRAADIAPSTDHSVPPAAASAPAAPAPDSTARPGRRGRPTSWQMLARKKEQQEAQNRPFAERMVTYVDTSGHTVKRYPPGYAIGAGAQRNTGTRDKH